MEVKPGYKQTEVGVIPGGLGCCHGTHFGDLRLPLFVAARQEPARRSTMMSTVTDYAAVRTPNVRNGRFVREGLRFTDEKSFAEWTARAIPQIGDILITREAPLGEVCLVPPDLRVCLGQRMMLYRPDPDNVVTGFLLHVLSSSGVQENLQKKIGGSTVGHARVADIRNLQIPLPPKKAEQRAIADVLGDADALVESLELLIAKKSHLKKAAMQRLLTGRTRLPGFHGEWEVKSLFDLAERKKELFDDGDWIEAEFLTDKGIRLAQTGNIGEGYFADKDTRKYISAESFKKLRCKEIQVGDLLICRLAEPAGRACILPDIGEDRMITAVDVTIFRPPASLTDRRFLVNVFNTLGWFQSVNERCGGTTRTRIARGQLE